jgi:hypothetical protein
MALVALLLPTTQAARPPSPVEEGPTSIQPLFSPINDAYVRVACPGCFLIRSFKSVHSVEVLARGPSGRYGGLQYLTREQGLDTDLAITVPLRPCRDYQLQIMLRFIDNNGERQNVSKFSQYNKESCQNEMIQLETDHQTLVFTVSILLSLVLSIVLLLGVCWVSKTRSRIQEKRRMIEEEDEVKLVL